MSTGPRQSSLMNIILFPEGTKFLHRQCSLHEAHFLAKLSNGTLIEVVSHGHMSDGGIDMENFGHATLGLGDLLHSTGLKLDSHGS